VDVPVMDADNSTSTRTTVVVGRVELEFQLIFDEERVGRIPPTRRGRLIKGILALRVLPFLKSM
jgi:hypothetical protein